MSYVAYIPNNDQYKTHFTTAGIQRRHKDFYIVRPAKTGNGENSVITIAPTQSDVARAKADVQREREEHINEVFPAVSQYTQKRRRNNTSAKTTAKKKKKA